MILGPRGEVRFVIRKRVDDEKGRMREQLEFMRGPAGRRFWTTAGMCRVPAPDLARHMCMRGEPTDTSD